MKPATPAQIDDELCFLIGLREVMINRFLIGPNSLTVKMLDREVSALNSARMTISNDSLTKTA